MSSWIGVYGRTRSNRNWMRQNYANADAQFREIHPIYVSSEKFEHGIVEHTNNTAISRFDYSWNIPCHWNSDVHFDQTKNDIRQVLKKLEKPRGVNIHLSPMSD